MINRSLPGPGLLLVLVLIVTAAPAGGGWLRGWLHRLPVDLENACGAELLDHEVRILLDGSFNVALAAADGADLRVTAADGLGRNGRSGSSSCGPTGALACLQRRRARAARRCRCRADVYYGLEGAEASGDAAAVFAAYDGFESTAVANAGEWDRYAGNSVLIEGAPGSWDDERRHLRQRSPEDSAGVEFSMQDRGFSGGTRQIGLAASPDVQNWTKHAAIPA